MSGTEAVMWAVEKDPALRSDFCNLTILEGAPDRERLRAKAAEAVATIPRLGQRVVSAPLRIVPPEWVDDPALDLDYHVRVVGVPGEGTRRDLLDLCAQIAAAPFDRSRPLWEFTLVEGLEDGRAALLQKVHHTITDGVGGLRLSLSLVDLEADPPPVEVPAPAPGAERGEDRHSPLDVVRTAIGDAAGRQAELARSGLVAAGHLLTHPQEAPGRVADAAGLAASLRRQVLVTERARSPVLAGRSLGRRFEISTLPLTELRELARRLGATVNDVFVTGVVGALGRYHDELGERCDELRLAMPVNLRDRDDAANRFAPSRVLVPTGPDDPVGHLAAVRERLRGVRTEPALGAADALASWVARLPTSVLVTATRAQARTVDFAASNLRGSPVPLWLAGRRILANHPFGPRAGSALNVTVLSYCDDLHAGWNLDPAAVAEPGLLLRCVDDSFAALLASG